MSLSLQRIISICKPDQYVAGSQDAEREIKTFCYRTEDLNSGSAFVNFKKLQNAPGAALILTEEICSEYNGPQLILGSRLKDCAEKCSLACHEEVLASLKILAVTGTNGKSTVVHLCRQMLEKVDPQSKPSSLGTLGLFCGVWSKPLANTTQSNLFSVGQKLSLSKLHPMVWPKVVCRV
jgi:UDP-N-acetylmuramyl tripeptide synthase